MCLKHYFLSQFVNEIEDLHNIPAKLGARSTLLANGPEAAAPLKARMMVIRATSAMASHPTFVSNKHNAPGISCPKILYELKINIIR